MVQKPDSLKADLLVVAILVVAGAKFTLGLENAFDIALYDESFYLYWGVNLGDAGLPSAGLAPLYAIWYFILSLLEPNRVNLYYLNYKLMTVLPPILTYAVLRRNTVSILVSLAVSWFLLVARANVLAWPKVSHFVLILILAGLLFINNKRSLIWVSLFASMGSLLVSYVRPEYFFVYLLASVLLVVACVREYKKFQRHHFSSLVAYGLFSVLLLWTLGLPVAGARSLLAFGQHFSLNWVSWSGSSVNPWTNWKEIVSRNFGSVHSIPEAFAENPSAFLHHVAWNLREFVKRTPPLIFPTIFPFDNLSAGVAGLWLAGLHVAGFHHLRNNISPYKMLSLLVGLFVLPTLAAVVVIYPRDHYLLLLGVLTVVVMVVLLTDHTREHGQINISSLLLIGLLVIALTPSYLSQERVHRPNLDTIRFIRSLRIGEPVNLLEAEGGYNMYLGGNFRRVAEYEKNVDFKNFLVERNIAMVVVSDTLLRDSRFKDDPAWQRFLVDHQQLGYVQREIPLTDRKLIVKADLLSR